MSETAIVLAHGFWGGGHGSKLIVELSRKGAESVRAVQKPLTSFADDTDRGQKWWARHRRPRSSSVLRRIVPRRYARAAHRLNRTHFQLVSTSEVFDRPLTRASFSHAPRAVGRRT